MCIVMGWLKQCDGIACRLPGKVSHPQDNRRGWIFILFISSLCFCFGYGLCFLYFFYIYIIFYTLKPMVGSRSIFTHMRCTLMVDPSKLLVSKWEKYTQNLRRYEFFSKKKIRYDLEFLAKHWLNKSLFVIGVLFKIILLCEKRNKFVREKKGRREKR